MAFGLAQPRQNRQRRRRAGVPTRQARRTSSSGGVGGRVWYGLQCRRPTDMLCRAGGDGCDSRVGPTTSDSGRERSKDRARPIQSGSASRPPHAEGHHSAPTSTLLLNASRRGPPYDLVVARNPPLTTSATIERPCSEQRMARSGDALRPRVSQRGDKPPDRPATFLPCPSLMLSTRGAWRLTWYHRTNLSHTSTQVSA